MKVLSVVGARPNLMKAAPFLRRERIKHVLVHTGQHHSAEMSGQFFDELCIRVPDYSLSIGGGSPGEQLGRTMIELEPVLSIENPDWVLVYGDVNAACASAIVAKRNGFLVAHVEAGLRSYDNSMPEEINRILVDSICDLHFAPTKNAFHVLKSELLESVHFVGNIMIDTLEYERQAASQLPLMPRVPLLEENGYVVLTLHRPSNVDDKDTLENILTTLSELDIPIVFPVHPRTKANMQRFGITVALESPFIACEPLSYRQMLRMNMSAKAILTDSGGIQEEACVLGVPCVTLRRNTERPITLRENGGTNRLAGDSRIPFHEWITGRGNGILPCIYEALKEEKKPFRPPLWDGNTAERIENLLRLNNHVWKSKRLSV